MLGKLKEKAGDKMVGKVVEQVAPSLQPHLEKIQELEPQQVKDDGLYREKVIDPALSAVKVASSGVAGLIPGFDDRFANALIKVRDELLVVDQEKVALVDDFAGRLPAVLMDGFRQSA